MIAIAAPARTATPVASQALCQARSATTAKNAPVSIMPSIAMFTTPLRSEITPPRAGRSSKTAAARVACQRLAVKSRRKMSSTPLMPTRGAGGAEQGGRDGDYARGVAWAVAGLVVGGAGELDRGGEAREGAGDEDREDDRPADADTGITGGHLALSDGTDLVAE